MNKKGFTLIELLSVIVILAIIALIAVPLILNVVADARKGAFKSSVYGIIKASEYTYAKNILDNKQPSELIFEYEGGTETSNVAGYQLDYNGERPESGTLIMKRTGEIALALFDGTYCATKDYDEQEVVVTNVDYEECILEAEKPSIELLGDNPIYIEINTTNPGTFIDPGVIALNIDETPNNDITIEIYQEDNLVNDINTSELGEYKIIYTVTDDGKINQVERIVIIKDTTPPVLTVPSSETITTDDVANYDLMAGVTVTDNSGEQIPVTLFGNLGTIPGTYAITYRAEDSSGNFVEAERIITVQDIESPLITILGNNPSTINVGDSYIDEGATALDNIDGDLTSSIIVTGNVNPNIPGTYQITYTVTDSSNNTTVKIRTVNVIDNIPPNISFGTNGNSNWSKTHSTTINVVDTHSEIDNSSLRYLITNSSSGITKNDITNTFNNDNTINMTTQTGSYYIWVFAQDTSGNEKIERSNVFRLDNTAPVISGIEIGVDDITTTSFRITRSGSATDNHSGLYSTPYIYQTSLDGSNWITSCTNNTDSCNVSGLIENTPYYYRICVVDNVTNESCTSSQTVETEGGVIYGTLNDTRDGKTYTTVKIGDRWWMAENLRYTGNGCLTRAWNSFGPFTACRSYGTEIHYQWKAAMNGSSTEGAQGICPSGWYVPTDEDWKVLEGTLDSVYGVGHSEWDKSTSRGSDVGEKLKSTAANGTNESGFNAYMIGTRNTIGGDPFPGYDTNFWTSSMVPGYENLPEPFIYIRMLFVDWNTIDRGMPIPSYGFSVRCIMQQ